MFSLVKPCINLVSCVVKQNITIYRKLCFLYFILPKYFPQKYLHNKCFEPYSILRETNVPPGFNKANTKTYAKKETPASI